LFNKCDKDRRLQDYYVQVEGAVAKRIK